MRYAGAPAALAWATLACSALSLSGCAFGDGEPYGHLQANVDARYQLQDDRAAGDDGWQALASGVAIRIDSAELHVEAVELIDTSASAVLGGFDPANPPEGYGTCHGGHCHSEDGRLVPYEEIEAEIAGGAGSRTALALDEAEVDLLRPEPVALACGSCILERGFVGLAHVGLHALHLSGVVRDPAGRFAGERHFEVEAHDPAVLDVLLDLPLDDDHASQIDLALQLDVSAALLDEIDFVALATDGDIDLSTSEESLALVRAAAAEIDVRADVARHEP